MFFQILKNLKLFSLDVPQTHTGLSPVFLRTHTNNVNIVFNIIMLECWNRTGTQLTIQKTITCTARTNLVVKQKKIV